ncbi:MAG TPA: hypothetical protein VGM03_19725 [Phycisphaerae bacterium]
MKKRFAEGRIFYVNCKMPFEYFLDCFQWEHPFFLVSQLEDGRIAIVPNALVIPKTLWQAGYGPQDILPTEYEYVTTKWGAYPLIITAHPIYKVEEWFKKFERYVLPMCKQTLADFVNASFETLPLKFEPIRTPEALEV